MKELILKDVLELEENKYASFMTFEEYLSLIQNEIINFIKENDKNLGISFLIYNSMPEIKKQL